MEALRQTVLVVNVHMEVGHHPRHRHAAEVLQLLDARLQDGHVPPELVDDGPLDPGPLVGLQKGHGAIELGKDAAPVDVPHQEHGGVGQLRHAHVHDVVLLEVDLRGAARALQHDDVEFLLQAAVGLHDVGDEFQLALIVVLGPDVAQHLAVDDDLAAHVGGGLQQDGVHAHIGGDARRLRLHHLGPAHLPAVGGDEGIEGHILALEGGHPITVLLENAAEARAEQAFARVGHGALDHDALCHFTHSLCTRASPPEGGHSLLPCAPPCGTSRLPGRGNWRSP